MPGESQETPDKAPDPTVLTTEALQREVRSLESVDEQMRQEFKDAMRVRRQAQRRETDELKHSISGIRKADRRLLNAKMAVIHERFKSEARIQTLIEDQRKERKEDDRRALDAALAAAEKARVADTEASDRANTKTELSTAEQLKQQNSTSNQANANVVTLLNSLQTRVEKIENIKQSVVEAKSGNSQQWLIAGIMGSLLFGLIGTIIAIVTFVVTHKQ